MLISMLFSSETCQSNLSRKKLCLRKNFDCVHARVLLDWLWSSQCIYWYFPACSDFNCHFESDCCRFNRVTVHIYIMNQSDNVDVSPVML